MKIRYFTRSVRHEFTKPIDGVDPLGVNLCGAAIAVDACKKVKGSPSISKSKAKAKTTALTDENFGASLKSNDVEPENWQKILDTVREWRKNHEAPVDTMGCSSLYDKHADEETQRFQILIGLMLSSQTKDQITAAAMEKLKQEFVNGLTVDSIRDSSVNIIASCISQVGFHNTKAKHILETADILTRKYDKDIPSTYDGLISLPGVGPKMATLTMSYAWDIDYGIGVDVHVHRITNLWKWHCTKTPEATRKKLERWLPRKHWREINHMLVGFGQTLCKPKGKVCKSCPLYEKNLCKSAQESGGKGGDSKYKISW